MLSVGIDGALDYHQVEIQKEGGIVLWKRRISNDKEGLNELCNKLDEIKKNTGDINVVGIYAEAMGSYLEPFRYQLTQKGYRFVIINALKVKSARVMKNLDKVKNDKIDASTLASLPWFDLEYREKNSHERYEISELTRLYRKMQEQETRMKNSLIADLVRIFPEFLRFIKNLDTKTNFKLLHKYPTPAKMLTVPEGILLKFVKKISSNNHGIEFVKNIKKIAKNSIGIPDENGIYEYRIKFFIDRIWEIKNLLDELEKEINVRTKGNEDIDLIDDMRGIARIKAASIYGEVGPIEQFKTARKLQGYGGNTPRKRQSGKMDWTGGPTRMANHYLRQTISVCAKSLALNSEEFRVIYYREKMKKGKTNTQAFIIVGNRLLYHVFTILKNKKPYRKRMPMCSR